jgi:excisionase family DNA binding protein
MFSEDRRLLSTNETAELLGCHPKSVYALIDRRVLTPVRLTDRPRSRLRFDVHDVEAMIERRKVAA